MDDVSRPTKLIRFMISELRTANARRNETIRSESATMRFRFATKARISHR